jgi:signal transduction histidine kinase
MDFTSKVQREEDNLETLVRTREDELSGLASHLQSSHEEQNRKLARELHDELGSLLTAAKLDITFIKSKCAKAAPELVAKCDRIASMIDQAATLKRRIIDQLRPSTLDMLGLGPAVRELVENFTGDSGITTDVDIDEDSASRQGEPALVIYRVIEAALDNIREHAGASSIRVAIARTPATSSSPSFVSLRIADDGRGSDGAVAGKPIGVALAGIRQRIDSMGGSVSFAGTPGRGSVIEATLPLVWSSDGG